MARRLFILSVLALGFLIVRDRDRQPIEHLPGILVADNPVQVNVQPRVFMLDDYRITPKARIELRARVLSSESYYINREADLSPLDLALGWGVMSDQAVLDRIKITQGNRWYHTRYEMPPPLSDEQIISNSSNMHMIPATHEIRESLEQLRVGDIIFLSGHLVDVDHDSGWYWRTSMSRTDTGSGACEIVYVESLTVD